MQLTSKQEKFAQAIADGMTQADAYRAAFDVREGTKPETVHDSASKMMAKPEVAQRVADLRKKLENKALWSREMSVQALVKAFKLAEKSGNPAAMTGAIKEINAMHGYNAPKKIDLSNEDGSLKPEPVQVAVMNALKKVHDT
jgi:hypothetical protein